jgi:hypothetical protein
MATANEIALAQARAQALAIELGISEPAVRVAFMESLTEMLGRKFCSVCWESEKPCHCDTTNDHRLKQQRIHEDRGSD